MHNNVLQGVRDLKAAPPPWLSDKAIPSSMRLAAVRADTREKLGTSRCQGIPAELPAFGLADGPVGFNRDLSSRRKPVEEAKSP